jgi:hypothetical protein
MIAARHSHDSPKMEALPAELFPERREQGVFLPRRFKNAASTVFVAPIGTSMTIAFYNSPGRRDKMLPRSTLRGLRRCGISLAGMA